jgi:hypothetical protein
MSGGLDARLARRRCVAFVARAQWPSVLGEICRRGGRLFQRGTNGRKHLRKILRDELRGDSEHAITGAPELLVSTRITKDPLLVIAAVNLNDQPFSGREEINDETEHWDLATKLDTELSRAERTPERGFRVRGSLAHAMSVSGED